MKQSFTLLNIKCEGCANSLKKSLKNNFGDVEVDLNVLPRVITLDIENNQIENLQKEVKRLGYPFASLDMNFVEDTKAKAKRFVSCAIGKMDL